MSPLLRSRATALAVSRPTLLYPVTLRSSAAARLFSQTAAVNAGGAHGDHYDPPTGWLWGEEPTPGKKKEREDWELIWYFGMFGSLGLATIAYAFKPDTSIQTWALEEARRRLEKEGILPDPDNIKKE